MLGKLAVTFLLLGTSTAIAQLFNLDSKLVEGTSTYVFKIYPESAGELGIVWTVDPTKHICLVKASDKCILEYDGDKFIARRPFVVEAQ